MKPFMLHLDRDTDVFPCSFTPYGFSNEQSCLPTEERVPCRSLRIEDCLAGLDFARGQGWYDLDSFDKNKFDSITSRQCASWVIPERFLAMCDPMSVIYHNALTTTGQSIPSDVDISGWQGDEELIEAVREEADALKDFFVANNVKLLVRLNDPSTSQFKLAYPENWFEPFTKCVSLCFTDGGTPDESIILEFIKLTQEYKDGVIAVHCQAGMMFRISLLF